MSIDKITKEHVIRAISRIEDEQIVLKPSTRYDVIIEGRRYPPKEVMRIANLIANGTDEWPLSGGGPTNRLLGDLGFAVMKKPNSPESDRQSFINLLQAVGKDNLLQYFDFVTELVSRLNLEQDDKRIHFAVGSYQLLSITIGQRYCLTITRADQEHPWHFIQENKEAQDDNIVVGQFHSTPPAYYYRVSDASEVSARFEEIVSACQKELRRTDKSSFRKYNNKLFEQAVFDIAFRNELIRDTFSSENEKACNYWVFQCNPNAFDFETAVRRNAVKSWTVSAHKDRITPGDKVIIWLTGKNAGCYALARVTSPPSTNGNSANTDLWKTERRIPLQAEIEITHNFVDHPITANLVKNTPGLENLKVGSQGTNFSATKEEYEILLSLATGKPGVVAAPALAILSHHRPFSRADVLADLFMEESTVDRIVDQLKRKKNIILQGPPGVGKTFVAKRIAYLRMEKADDRFIEMIQFHQSYSYEDFIQGYRPKENGGFELRNGVFYQFCVKAKNDPGNAYFFIIDEINRGNLSKIFGELMMLIEHDKRGPHFGIPLTYSQSHEDRFYIPENIYVIGTMNTADRSLAMVDFALRRRFAFISLLPCFNHNFRRCLAQNGISDSYLSDLIGKIEELNAVIKDDKNLGEGFLVGHSYFSNVSSEEDVMHILNNEIEPLVKEYWFDNTPKVEEVIRKLNAW